MAAGELDHIAANRGNSSNVSLADEDVSHKTSDQQVEDMTFENEKTDPVNSQPNWISRSLKSRKRRLLCCAASSIIIGAVAFPLM